MRTLYISEILGELSKYLTEDEKLQYLRQHDSRPLRLLLFANYSKSAKFLLPKGPSKFKRSDAPGIDLAETNLYAEAKKMYIFVEGGVPTLQQVKREMLYQNILEMLHQDEADILELIKDKNLATVFNLDVNLVNKAFPGLLQPEDLVVDSLDTKPTLDSNKPAKRGRGRLPGQKFPGGYKPQKKYDKVS